MLIIRLTNMNRNRALLIINCISVCLFFSFYSCKTTSVSQLTGVLETVKTICENPHKYLNKEVQLQGAFLGWSGNDCHFVPDFAHQIMRSDWVFSDIDSNCIYVTGGKPDFLDPLREEDIGKKIQLKAKLLKNNENKLYLEYISAYMSTINN